MLEAETALRAKAYIALLVFILEVVICIGLFLLLRASNYLAAASSMAIGIAAALLVLMGRGVQHERGGDCWRCRLSGTCRQ